jgi:ASC-1-like (ASCH) protein
MRTKTLWIKDAYLQLIFDGRKTVEVRVAYNNVARLQPGDQLLLNDRYLYTVRRVAIYADFEALLAHEDPAAIAPDLPPGVLLPALRGLYPREKETLGVVALEIAPAEQDARADDGPR